MKLLIGLGNPGAEHARNRHNIGFMALDAIAEAHGFGPWRNKFQGQLSEGHLGGEKCLLLKPSTFMNESGRSATEAVRFYKFDLYDVIVLHDELDLAPAKVRVKTGGGVAGHNGLKSLTRHIGNDYVRVRIGIGHPGDKSKVHGHVLKDFSKTELIWAEPLIGAIATSAPLLAKDDIPNFMNDVARAVNGDIPGSKKKSDPASSKPATKDKAQKPANHLPKETNQTGPFARLRGLFGTEKE
jgi:PTH1 family peptidyl-tRNA hydrolase